jgi:Fe(3+) dicitrate transport protein
MDARYQNLQVINLVGNELVEKNYRNKKVEYAPDQIIRAGVTAVIGKLTTTLQVSHTSEVFTDANNTRQPTANAQNGLIPSYTITDLCFNYRMPKGISIRGGLNNLFDTHYFTRRSSGYPGPGLLPADGRTFFLTFGWNMTGR